MSTKAKLKNDAKKRLKELLGEKKLPPCLMILSPDEIRRERVLTLLRDRFLGSSEFTSINASELKQNNIEAIFSEATSPSLFSPSSCLVIRQCDSLNAAVTKLLIPLLKKTNSNVFLLGKPLQARSVLRKFFTESKSILELDEAKGFELQRWIAKECKRAEISEISKDAIAAIASIANDDCDLAYRVVTHLSLYSNDGKVTLKDVSALFESEIIPNEFELLDQIMQGNLGKKEAMLGSLLRTGKNPFLMTALFGRNLANYRTIRAMLDKGMGSGQVRGALGVSPWIFNKQATAAKSRSEENFRKSMHAILRADSKLKNKSLGAEEVFGQFLSNL